MRYLIFAQTFLLVSIAVGLGHVRNRDIQLVAMGLVIVWNGSWYFQLMQARQYSASFPGGKEAAKYIMTHVADEEPCIASSPFILTLLSPEIGNEKEFLVEYRKEHDKDLLSGPSIQKSDFSRTNSILQSKNSRKIWTVDVVGLFGKSVRVKIPDHYQLHSEERFPERYGYRIDYLVREYRLIEGQ